MADRVVTQVKLRPPLPSLAKHTPQKRVAAYARVSADSAEQPNSVEAQKDYFQKLISEHSDWLLVDVYADEGIFTRFSSTDAIIETSFLRHFDPFLTQ